MCDGVDNDCDAETVDGSDETAPLTDSQFGVCLGARKVCQGSLKWQNDYTIVPGYSETETCDDNVDNNCDDDVYDGCNQDLISSLCTDNGNTWTDVFCEKGDCGNTPNYCCGDDEDEFYSPNKCDDTPGDVNACCENNLLFVNAEGECVEECSCFLRH